MKVLENPMAAAELIADIHENMGSEERLPGLHVSDLIYCLRKSWARRHGYRVVESDITTLMFMTGRALHGRMELVEGETLVRVDGVHGSIDRVEQEEGEPPIPCEIKTTYASAARDITTNPNYLDQLGAYCYMMGVTRGRLYVLYLNGIYAFQRKKPAEDPLAQKLASFGYATGDRPMLLAYDVEFTPQELEQHWQVLMGRKAILLEADRTGVEPPLGEHWPWECKFCGIKDAIGCPGGGGTWLGNFNVEGRRDPNVIDFE